MMSEKEKHDSIPEFPEENDDLLAANISRVMADAQLPRLDDQTAGRMLAELKQKQQKLFLGGETVMATPATLHTDRWQDYKAGEYSGRWVLILPAALLVVLMLGGLLFWVLTVDDKNSNGNIGNVVQDDGKAKTDEEKPLRVAQDLGKFIEAELTRREMADGTILVANAGANYSIDGPREVTLNSGDLFLIVAKANAPLVIQTVQGDVRATGTRFAVSANKQEKTTSAAVAQGTVELAGEAGEIELTAGQQGSLKKSEKPTREPAPRLSYLVSWAKEALTQQELLVEKGEKENGLVAVDPWGQESKLSLRKYNVDIYIEDGIARTTIDQTFFNHNPSNTEGTFYFPLPPDASVSRLAMYVAGTLNEGGMVSRQRGQQIYNEIRYQQRDPALLEMMEGNMFKMRIFPLEGRQEKRIFLSYTQQLDELYGTMKYWFPMDHTNSVAGELKINVRVKDGAKRFAPQSSTHDVKVSTDGNDLLLEYSQEKIKPDQDFLLHLVPEEKLAATRVAVCEKDGQKFLFARIHPEMDWTDRQTASEPRQWIVLNDISASRSRIESEAQRYVLARLIEEADDDDSVFLIDLNTQAIPVTVEPLNVRSAAAIKLGEHRMPFKIGACNIEAGIAAVKKAIADHNLKNPQLVYLGDGVATDGASDVASLTGLLSRDVPFIGIGVGKSVDALLMQTAADMTGGMFTTINPDEDIDWRVFDLVAALNTPRMNKIQVLLFDENDKPVDAIAYPSSRGLADGETLTVVARCDGELPAELVFRGEVNGKTIALSTDLSESKENAEFIPRLWAKRHIDELLKSDMPREEEITELSKQYYVVTPYTSLIVLESDAMYEEFNVERGRKDHWALYDAPKTIEVVREEINWNQWGWYGHLPSEDGQVDVAAQPKTVQEIVDSMQLRINAPFYFFPETGPGSSRDGLYLLAESLLADDKESESKSNDDAVKFDQAMKTRTSRLLTLWYLLAAGREDVFRGVYGSDESDSDSDSGTATADGKSLVRGFKARAKMPQLQSFGRPATMQELMLGDIRRPLNYSLGFIPRDQFFDSDSSIIRRRSPVMDRLQRPELLLESQLFGTSSRGMNSPLHFSFQQAMQTRWGRINRDVENFNRQYGHWGWDRQWSTWESGSQGIDLSDFTATYSNAGLKDLLGTDGAIPESADFEFLMEEDFISALPALDMSQLQSMRFEDRNFDINGRLSLNQLEGFGELDFRELQNLQLFNGTQVGGSGAYRYLGRGGRGSSVAASGFMPVEFSFSGNSFGGGFGLPASNFFAMPSEDFEFERSVEFGARARVPQVFMDLPAVNVMFRQDHLRRISPLVTFTSLNQSEVAQPAMVSVIAADFLKLRRDELAGQKLDEKGQRELKLLDAALANVESAAAHVENTGPFWSGDWSYQPRIDTFQPPQIQAWSGYSWSYDLTQYAAGLCTNSSDILQEVVAQYSSSKPLGNVSDDARKQIEAARNQIAPVRIRSGRKAETGDRQEELLVASGDRFALTTRNEMYLTERMICDGQAIWQIYDELGIAARREATEARLSALRNMVPHLLPPTDVLCMFHNVELIAEDDDGFTLRLTIADVPEERTADDESDDAESDGTVDEVAEENAAEENADEKEEQPQIVIIIRVDRTGRILEKSLQIDAVDQLKVVFDYESKKDHVSIQWIALKQGETDDVSDASDANDDSENEGAENEWKKIASTQYVAQTGMMLESVFVAKPEKLVVIDMPLRRPDYYSQKITDLTIQPDDLAVDTGAKEKQRYKKLDDAGREEHVRLLRHHALASIQELNWRRWSQECGPAKASMLEALKVLKESGKVANRGDVTLLGSAGSYGLSELVETYLIRDKIDRATNLTQIAQENLLVAFFQNVRNHGWNLETETFKKENGLVGHLATYLLSDNWHDRDHLFNDFESRFGDSPLLLALTSKHTMQKRQIEPWLKLNEHPRWHGMALMMAAPYAQDQQQKDLFAEAYWSWRDELKETDLFKAGYDLPLNQQMAVILKEVTPDKFATMISERIEHVKEADSLTGAIQFAEHAASWGLNDAATEAMEFAKAKAAADHSQKEEGTSGKKQDVDNLPLSIRLAIGQGYWTCGMHKQALKQYETVLAQLSKDDIAASPALLATAARIAAQAGDNSRAIELEEQSLAAEHKYLPEMINLTAFNQRYNWLWQQYSQAIVTASGNKDEAAVEQITARAKQAWLRWQEVDKDNLSQSANIATMLKSAGADDEEIWQHLSTAIDRKPRDSASYVVVANWYQSNNELARTEHFLDQAYRWDTANPQLLFQRAEVLESLKRGGEAVEVYKKIAEGQWAPALQGWAEKAKVKLTEMEEL